MFDRDQIGARWDSSGLPEKRREATQPWASNQTTGVLCPLPVMYTIDTTLRTIAHYGKKADLDAP